MAGPLAGLGQAAQQLPISNTFQPGGANNGTQQVREDNRQGTNVVQSQNSGVNQTQNADTQEQNALQSRDNNTTASAQSFSSSENEDGEGRGTNLDILV